MFANSYRTRRLNISPLVAVELMMQLVAVKHAPVKLTFPASRRRVHVLFLEKSLDNSAAAV